MLGVVLLVQLLKYVGLSFICLVAPCEKLWAATDVFEITCQIEPQAPLYRELEVLFGAAFADLNIPFRMQYMPVLRSISDVESARADGNCLRIEALIKRGPFVNLVLVEQPLTSITFDVWVLGEGSSYPNFSDIVADGGLVGYERGVWIVEQKLEALVPANQLVAVAEVKSGVEMLAAKRIGALVHTEMKIAEAVAVAEKRRSVKIRRAGTLTSAEMYLVLNKKHRALAPKLARVLSVQLERFCEKGNAPLLPILCTFYQLKAAESVVNESAGDDSPGLDIKK